jgi:peptidylprolyl isomerase
MAKPEDTLTLETTKGKVVIEMRPDLAPGHVARIKELVKDGFYDGIVFHRVIDGFMAQTGCPHGTGTGGSGKKLKAEFNKEPHVRGIVSMARASNPDSGDSQFFICFDDARFLGQPVHSLGEGDRGHGERRQDQARRARSRIPTRSSKRRWGRKGPSLPFPHVGKGGPCARTSSISHCRPTALPCGLASPRDSARLLVVKPGAPSLEDRGISDLPGLLRAGDCLVANDSKVIARAPAWTAHRARKRRAGDRGPPCTSASTARIGGRL